MNEVELIEIFKEALEDYYNLKKEVEDHEFKSYSDARQYYNTNKFYIEVSKGIITTRIIQDDNRIIVSNLFDIRKRGLYIKNHSIDFVKELIKTDL